LLILLFAGLFVLLGQQLLKFKEEWPSLSYKLSSMTEEVSRFISDRFNANAATQGEWIRNLAERTISFLGITLYDSGTSIVLALLIPVYAALILFYRKMLCGVLLSFFPEEDAETVILILHKTIHTYYDFVKGMLLVYLIVGILNSVG